MSIDSSGATLIDRVPVANQLGEGVLWHERSQTVWWTDIESSSLYSYQPLSKALTVLALPERLCSFGFVANSPLFIGAFASGFALFDPVSGEIVKKILVESDQCYTRMNDGRVDRQGRFWVGSMVESSTSDGGSAGLYCIDEAGNYAKKECGIHISNSLCWSLDSSKLYFADSPTGEIYSYDFEPINGLISNRQVFARTSDNVFPDGSTIDSSNHLWNAQWGGSQIVCYSPQGHIVQTITLPVSQPSCVAFGGANLDWFFVTSAKVGLTASQQKLEPYAGDLFIYQLNSTGVSECEYLLGKNNALQVPTKL